MTDSIQFHLPFDAPVDGTGAPSLDPEPGARCVTSHGRPRSPARASHQMRADLSPAAEGVNRENVPGRASAPLLPRKPAGLGPSALAACPGVHSLYLTT